ncbi:DUF2516 family protein [Terrabacter sp. 2TAF16]|jgi:hypothetical protein|uniref:DUF2516 family protein n=1 Tax=unclassified Terrabacter TaxID=2630222 RepID=UPI003F9A70EE
MQLYSGFQNVVLLVLGVVALGCEVFAFVDALRHPEKAYVAAGKRTRTFWLVLLGAALAIGFVTLFNPLSIFGLLAFVGAAVYLADVRPALRQVRGIGGRSNTGW